MKFTSFACFFLAFFELAVVADDLDASKLLVDDVLKLVFDLDDFLNEVVDVFLTGLLSSLYSLSISSSINSSLSNF